MSSPGPAYAERLAVPLRWWALSTMFLASVLLAFLVALPAALAFASVGALTAGTVALFLSYGGARVVLADGEFQAGRAHIPVGMLARPVALDREHTRRLAGVQADARAYLLLRPYLRRAIRVDVVDASDPTPYWLVSTRHPHRLTDALSGAIAAAGRG